MTEEAMQQFINAIIEDANAQKQELLDKIEKQRAIIIEQNEHEVLTGIYNEIQMEISRLKNEISRQISAKSMDIRKELLKKREEITGLVFEKLKAKLLAFKGSEEYKNHIRNQLSLLKGLCTLYCAQDDTMLFQSICAELGLNAQILAHESITLGGYMAKTEKSSTIINESIDEKLLLQYETFREISKMIIS